jgi:hypothetical protein
MPCSRASSFERAGRSHDAAMSRERRNARRRRQRLIDIVGGTVLDARNPAYDPDHFPASS